MFLRQADNWTRIWPSDSLALPVSIVWKIVYRFAALTMQAGPLRMHACAIFWLSAHLYAGNSAPFWKSPGRTWQFMFLLILLQCMHGLSWKFTRLYQRQHWQVRAFTKSVEAQREIWHAERGVSSSLADARQIRKSQASSVGTSMLTMWRLNCGKPGI